MSFLSVIAASAASIVGAAVWMAIAVGTGYEIGWIAWLVGLLIGAASAMAGGKGQKAALLCAGLAVLAILGGKYFTVQHLYKKSLQEEVGKVLTQEAHQQDLEDAKNVLLLNSDVQYAVFMVARGMVEAKKADEVSPEDINDFKTHYIPLAREMAANPPSYEQWRQQQVALAKEMAGDVGIADAMKASLGILDIVFMLLGITTAYKVGMGKTEAAAS